MRRLAGIVALAVMASIAACTKKSAAERYPEIAAGIVADLQPVADGYFQRSVRLEAVGRTTSGGPCGFAYLGSEKFFIHADDRDVVALRADSPAISMWSGLCELNKSTPIRSSKPIRVRPLGDAVRVHEVPKSPGVSTTWVAAQSAVRAQLRAPETARFEEVRTHDGKACGLVHAENGFGGRSSPERFIFTGSFALLEDVANTEGFSNLWREHCASE